MTNQYQSHPKQITECISQSSMHDTLKSSYWITLENYFKPSNNLDKMMFETKRQVRLFVNRLCNQSKQHIMAVVLIDIQPNGGKYHAHLLLTPEHHYIDVDTIQDTWIGIIGKKKFNMRVSLEKLMRQSGNLTDYLVTIRDECCKVYHHDERHMKNALAYALRKHEELMTIYGCPKKGQCKRKPCNMASQADWNRHLNGEKLHPTE